MIFSNKSILLSVCVIFVLFNVMDSATAIVGGKQTTIAEHKYIVQVTDGTSHCGGTLIAPKYVLTAAHCAEGKASKYRVIGGSTDEKLTCNEKLTSCSKVEKITKHEDYMRNGIHYDDDAGNSHGYDIALLKLKKDLTGTNVKEIAMCQASPRSGDQITISGWGLTSETPVINPTTLYTTTLPFYPQQFCINKYGDSVKEIGFCGTYLPGNKGCCTGDSGGPGIVNNKLCGVIGFTKTCGRSLSVFADVYKLRNFIQNAMGTGPPTTTPAPKRGAKKTRKN